jgi:hypothetical protein
MTQVERVIVCRPMHPHEDDLEQAARIAVEENPLNQPNVAHMRGRGIAPDRKSIAVSTTKYWRSGKVDLTVGFLDNPPAALRKRIVAHMNAWSAKCNVRFRETTGQAQVRIARITNDPNWDGYWSYVGTDILTRPKNEPTMNFEGFTMNTPESEFHRVVRHEAGHTLGCEHEHVRRAVVDRIDKEKAYTYFFVTQKWDRKMVDAQVLTPIEEYSLIGTPKADETSIMCYDLPGEIMKNGKAVVGGNDINTTDATFMAKIYPKSKTTPTKPKTTSKSSASHGRKKPSHRNKARVLSARG